MANVTVTIKVEDDAVAPAPVDGVLVRVYDDVETASTIYPAPVGMPVIPLIGFWTLFGGE